VFVGKRHLDDSALIRRYQADRGLDALDASDEEGLRHLVRCPSCEARYIDMQRAFDDAGEAVVARADAACTPDLLAEQHARILRRIDAQYEGPRVLAFPRGSAPAHASAQPPLVMLRWAAVAAAAGLVIGLTAGQLLHIGRDGISLARNTVSAPAPTPASASIRAGRTTPVMRAANGVPAVDENEFLSEVDLAAAGPQAAELRAIYAFTLETPRDPAPLRTIKH
jgi:hypothetical protein